MSFRCTACFDKSYDKAWKLQRHIRESSKCFEQFNPGESATRFRCTSCDHTCSREEDLERHHGKIHPDIVFATATGSGATEEALQPTLRSHEHCGITPGLNPETLLDTKDHSDDIERTDQHESPESAAAVTKRKSSELGGLSPDHKRVCIESNLIDLDTLSLVDDSDARETFTPNTTKNKDQHATTTWTSELIAPSALGSSDISALLRSTLLSDFGAPRSMSISGSGIGSLFGRPSTHAYEPWRTWSYTTPHAESVRSLGSVNMPAPMLEKVDEELLFSRGMNDPNKPRYRDHWATEFLAKMRCSDLNADCEDVHAPRGVPCIFRFLGCDVVAFKTVGRWHEHCKSHFRGKAPLGWLHCPYKSCEWAASTQDGEDAWDQRWKHFDQDHDILSQIEKLSEGPDSPLCERMWSAGLISDVQLLEMGQTGRLSLSTPFVVPKRSDESRRQWEEASHPAHRHHR
jgi:hypothetical protein